MSPSADIIRLPTAARPVSLGMYALPEMSEPLRLWWEGLARHFREAGVERVPDKLDTPDDLISHWLDKDLLFSQTCGFPLTNVLEDRVTLIATPIYDAPGCDGIDYRSMIIVRDDLNIDTLEDLRACDVAINNWDSQSGFNALRAKISTLAEPGERFFDRTMLTTGHGRSIEAVRNGEAHCAAIDGVTFALFERYRPEDIAGLRIIDQTDPSPGLPYITRRDIEDEELDAIRTGLFAALADPQLTVPRADLLLKGAEVVELDTYDKIRQMAVQGKDVVF